MRKQLCTAFLLLALLIGGLLTGANAATVGSALSSNKPFAILVYTSWSNYNEIYDNMKKLQQNYRNVNFARVNLNDEASAALFNGYIVIRQIPMVVIGKKGGKFSQIVDNDCAANYKCMSKRLRQIAR